MQLSALDLNLLVVLDALVRHGSVKAAAASLGLSPSATSHALARLRELLDDPVLVRSGRSMVLTPRAASMRGELADVLARVEGLLARPRVVDPASLRRGFRIATTDYAELEVLAPLSHHLHALAPGVDLHSQTYPPALIPALRRVDVDTLDLVLGVLPDPPADLRVSPLFRERFVLLMRRGHPASRGRLTRKRYAALDHVLVAPRGQPRGIVDELLAEVGLERRVARSVSNFHIAPRFVANSDCVLTVASRVAARYAESLDLVTRKPPLDLPGFELSAIWHQRHERDPEHAWLREQLVAVTSG